MANKFPVTVSVANGKATLQELQPQDKINLGDLANIIIDGPDGHVVTIGNAGGALTSTAIDDLIDSGNITIDTLGGVTLDQAFANTLPLSGGTMNGPITLSGAPTDPLHAVTKAYADGIGGSKVSKSGDTMTGILTLGGAPTVDLHAATKRYVDDTAGNLVSKAGSTMTGPLVLDTHPTSGSDPLTAATKQYVDNHKPAYIASDITSTATGDLAATDVQSALEELDNEKLALAGGTMSGTLTLTEASQTDPDDAATRAYADLKLPLAGGTMLGKLTLDPLLQSNPDDAATRDYVDTVAAGINYHPSVVAATTGTLETITGGTATYADGADPLEPGVDATITLSVALAALDTVTLAEDDRILVKDQANKTHNGTYTVSADGLTLTRAVEEDEPDEFVGGDFFFVDGGALNGGTAWVQRIDVATFGVDNIEFSQIGRPLQYNAGTGLSLNSFTFSVANTTVTTGAYGGHDSVATFTVNHQGQLTLASNAAIRSNAANLTGTTLSTTVVSSSLTSVGQLGSLGVTGAVTAGSFTGDGANLTNIAGANVTGTVANAQHAVSSGAANTANTVTDAAQANITSVGVLTGLDVSGKTTTIDLQVTGNAILGPQPSGPFWDDDVPLSLTRTKAAGVQTQLNLINEGGSAGAGAAIDFYTYTGGGNNPVSRISAVDDGNFSANLSMITKEQGNVGNMPMQEVARFDSSRNTTLFGNLKVDGTSNLGPVGNVVITGGTSGQVLSTNGSGTLSWASPGDASRIANGTSNVSVANNGNVSIGVAGTANVVAVSATQTTITGNTVITGNLTVNGSRTLVNSNVAYVVDPMIELGGGPNNAALTTNDGKDRGLLLHRHDGEAAVDSFMGWDNSNGEFAFGSNVSESSDVITFNSFGNVRAGDGFFANVTLGADPENALQAATKQYVDNSVDDYLPLTGGNLTGVLRTGPVGNVKITGGSSGQAIITDGSGNLSFTTISGGLKYSKEWHVSPTEGNDTTGDGSEAKPYATIAKAQLMMSSAEVLYLHAGIYSESVTWSDVNSDIIGMNDSSATYLTGSWNFTGTSSSVRVTKCHFVDNLTHSGAGALYLYDCNLGVNGIASTVTKSGTGYMEMRNVDGDGDSTTFNVTGTGTVVVDGGRLCPLVVNNAGATVTIQGSTKALNVTVTAGIFLGVDSWIYARTAGTPAITAAASAQTFVALNNSRIYNLTGAFERINIAAGVGYTILNTVYDKANSTLAGINVPATSHSDAHNMGALTVTGVSTLGAVGNVRITGGTNGQVLTSNGAGGLSFTSVGGGASIANGTSNVAIAAANGNVTVGVGGNANIATFKTTGANITGTLGVSGIANLASNLNVTGISNLGAVGNVVITGGTTGQVLTTNGAGALSWGTASSVGVKEYAHLTTTWIGNIDEGGTFLFSIEQGTLTSPGPGLVTLKAGKTYRLTAACSQTGGWFQQFQWVLNATNTPIGVESFTQSRSSGATTNDSLQTTASAVYTATVDTVVCVKLVADGGVGAAPAAGGISWGYIEEIGSSALTGNVTIGGGAASTSTTTGAVIVNGGIGVSGNAYIGANLNVAGVSTLGAVGNVRITGGTNGQVLTSNGAGGLSFTSVGGGASIANGTSNVAIAAANGNVTVGVGGNANIAVFKTTGANINGTLDVSGVSNLGPVGNVVITGGTSGQVLTTNGSGVLSWGGAQPGIIEYVAVSRLGTEQTGVTSGTDLILNTRNDFSGSVGTNYNTTTGVFTLTVGNTYELLAMPSFNAFSDNTVGYIEYQWCHAGNNAPITSAGAQAGIAQPNNNNTNESNSDLAYCIYTAAAGANTVKLRVTATNASGAGSATLRNAYTKATVKQLGTNSLASNVSLGGGAASTSTTTGGVVVSGGLGVSGDVFASNLARKKTQIVATGVDVTLDNIKIRMPATGRQELQISTVTGTQAFSGSLTGLDANSPYGFAVSVTATTTPAYMTATGSGSFNAAGDQMVYTIMNAASNLAYRITGVPDGSGNFLITIEALV
jgi:hypothetical protein